MQYLWELTQLIFGLSLFTFAAYFIMKKIKKRQFSQTSQNSIIQVVDGVQLAMGQNLYVTKVGEEYVLVAMGSNGIDMIKLDQKEIVNPKEKFDEMFGYENPQLALKNLASSMKQRLSKKNE